MILAKGPLQLVWIRMSSFSIQFLPLAPLLELGRHHMHTFIKIEMRQCKGQRIWFNFLKWNTRMLGGIDFEVVDDILLRHEMDTAFMLRTSWRLVIERCLNYIKIDEGDFRIEINLLQKLWVEIIWWRTRLFRRHWGFRLLHNFIWQKLYLNSIFSKSWPLWIIRRCFKILQVTF